MADKPAGEKTEKPTPKRKKDARSEGQIPRTNDVGGWLLLLAGTWLLPMLVGWGFAQTRDLLVGFPMVLQQGEGALVGYLADAVMHAILAAAPFVLLALLLGVLSQVAQIGWAPKKMKPNFKTLNVFKGIKQMFGPKLAADSAKNIAKLAAVVLLSLAPLQTVYETLVVAGSAMSVPNMAGIIAEESLQLIRNVSLMGLVIAAADYAMSKRRIDKQIKMTKQEMKEESKQQEGDPHVKGQIRQRQMAMSRNRMMADVPRADVVLVNPTHIAIALRYDPTRGAPIVLAKGAGAVADRIRELAEESTIPIVRDIPLARTLYRLVEVDTPIPVELYESVARILAFVYTLRARGRATGTHQSPFADAHQSLLDMPRPARVRTPA